MKSMMNKAKCCGCGACVNICPSQCIKMVMDEEGFNYPKIDVEKCIGCRRCEGVCPFFNYTEPKNKITLGYAGRIRETDALKYVASGGVYTAIASCIVDWGGVAVGVEMDEGMVKHTIVTNREMISRHSSSKYVQSNTGDIYLRVKSLLQRGTTVLFSGTPCQVVALHKYLGQEYKNLYSIDILCAGVCSPKVFQAYISLKEKKYNSKVKYVNFKKKTYGYHSSTMFVKFVNGKYSNHSRLIDEMMHVFTAHIADRPSCTSCQIKGVNRWSDLTLFDCWHYKQLAKQVDDDGGYTNIIVHSNKGLHLLEKSKEYLDVVEIDDDLAISLDGNMFKTTQGAHVNRKMFFEDFNTYGLETAIKNNCSITLMDKIKEALKPVLYKLRILEVVKKIGR